MAQLSLDSFKLPTTLSTNGVVHSIPGRADEVWTDISILGHGGQGTVYLQQLQSGPTRLLRAVKKLSQNQRHGSTGHVMRELNMMMAVRDHEELFVQLYGWFEDPRGVVFLAMEYVPHGDLAAYIKTTSVEQRDARAVTNQLLNGLSVLHSRHICHRDLKPQNVLLASLTPIKVKLADFGISKSTAGTDLRTRIGTAHYMAPELLGLLPTSLRLGNEYTTAVDMWALGFMVHELLTGRTPFLETPVECLSSGYPTVGTESVTTDMRLMLQFCDGQTGLLLQSLQATDPDAIQFIRSLIVPDPRARATADQALRHPWISGPWSEWEPQDDVFIVQAEPAWVTPKFYKGGYVIPAASYNAWAEQQSPSLEPRPASEPNLRDGPSFYPPPPGSMERRAGSPRIPSSKQRHVQWESRSPDSVATLSSNPHDPRLRKAREELLERLESRRLPLLSPHHTPHIASEQPQSYGNWLPPPSTPAEWGPLETIPNFSGKIERWMAGAPRYQGPFSDIDTGAAAARQNGRAKSTHAVDGSKEVYTDRNDHGELLIFSDPTEGSDSRSRHSGGMDDWSN